MYSRGQRILHFTSNIRFCQWTQRGCQCIALCVMIYGSFVYEHIQFSVSGPFHKLGQNIDHVVCLHLPQIRVSAGFKSFNLPFHLLKPEKFLNQSRKFYIFFVFLSFFPQYKCPNNLKSRCILHLRCKLKIWSLVNWEIKRNVNWLYKLVFPLHWQIHYIDKSIGTPFFRTEKCTSKSVATTMGT